MAFLRENGNFTHFTPTPSPAPGPTPVNFAQAQLNYQQEALNFIASGAGK